MHLTQHHEIKQALGGDSTIVIVTEDNVDIDTLYNKLWHAVFKFEMRFSRFLPNSELSMFNQRAGLDTPISDEFADLLRASTRMSGLSDGLHNPFTLPALQRAGYTHSAQPGYEHDADNDYTKRAVVSPDKLTMRGRTANIPYGTAIDMGGCGKGYLADLIADMLDAENVAGYWVSLSGDMAVKGVNEHGEPWTVHIQNAANPQKRLPTTITTDGSRMGIATSGTLSRPNQTLRGKHHLIDPKSGFPVDTDVRLATVIAERSVTADVLASCAVLLGTKTATKFLQDKGATGALIQTQHNITQYGEQFHKLTGRRKELEHAA